MKLRIASTTLLVLGSAAFCFAACGDDSETGGTGSGGDVVPFTIEGTDELFPGFEFSTGLQPEIDSPVKASFDVSASGSTHVSAQVAASGSKSKPVLSGVPDGGKVAIDGGFAMIGRLVVDLPPYSYDDEIPGLDNIEIPIVGEATFSPFAIGDEVTATAEIPEEDLPGIPLPAGIPGELVLHIGSGSVVEMTFTGTCAGIDGDQATYDGVVSRAGTLVIEPRVDITVLGSTTSFDIPPFTVDLALGSTGLAMSSRVDELGGAPAEADEVDASCSPDGSGGGDGAGGGSGQGGEGQGGSRSGPSTSTDAASTATGLGVTTGGGEACAAAIDCPNAYPCVENTCSDGSGVCDAGISFGDIYTDNCISVYCCAELAACTYAYADLEQCNDCIANGGGSVCDPFLACTGNNCNGGLTGICDSGLSTGDAGADACLSDACCTEFSDCTQHDADADSCVECFDQGGGPLCDAAIMCTENSGC